MNLDGAVSEVMHRLQITVVSVLSLNQVEEVLQNLFVLSSLYSQWFGVGCWHSLVSFFRGVPVPAWVAHGLQFLKGV